MKFVLTAFIWIVIIGSVVLYIGTREETVSHAVKENLRLQTTYDLEIFASFKLEPDPYSQGKASSKDKKENNSLLIMLNGDVAVKENSKHEEMKPVLFRNKVQLKTGKNEIYVEAFASDRNVNQDLFLRLRLLEGMSVKYEKTFWSGSENSIRGVFIIDVPKDL